MRKLFFIIALIIGWCSANAQNTTVVGPKKNRTRTAVEYKNSNAIRKIEPQSQIQRLKTRKNEWLCLLPKATLMAMAMSTLVLA